MAITDFFKNIKNNLNINKEKKIETENLEELNNITPTKKLDLISLIEKRQSLNPDKVSTIKVDDEIKHYQEIILLQKNKGTPEKLLTALRQKVVELQTEKLKIEIIYELLNQDNLLRTAFGKARQKDIYNIMIKKYHSENLELHEFKKIIQEISQMLKDKEDTRNESERLEDYYKLLF
ncbi:MAG: hypothetical protein PHU47_00410 [Candidatus ainarchaeum sp.]|nr:hypothetical protein [Candidatus ainarchaeum sp.]